MTKHTQGQWSFQKGKTSYAVQDDDAPILGHIECDDGGDIGWVIAVLPDDLPDRQSEANARLIAASPALLSALYAASEALAYYGVKEFEPTGFGCKRINDIIDAAIAQATEE